MNGYRRRCLPCLLVIILALSLLGGCSSSGAPPASSDGVSSSGAASAPASSNAASSDGVQGEEISGKITFMNKHLTEEIPAITIKETAARFMELYPGTEIELVSVPMAEGEAKFMAAMAAGSGPDTIDCSDAGIYRSYVKSGYLADLTDWYGTLDADFLAQISSASIEALKVDERLYGIPHWGGAYAFIYNKELYEAAGIDKLPETWEEFVEVAQKTTMDTDSDGTTDVWGFLTNGVENPTARMFAGYVWANGGELIAEDYSSANLAEPIAVRTLQNLTDMVHKYKVCSPNVTEINYQYITQSLAAGKVATVYEGPWLPAAAAAINPEMEGKIGVYPVPPLAGSTQKHSTVTILIPIGISSQCSNMALAEKWMEFNLSNECQTMYAKGAGFSPTNSTVHVDDVIMDSFTEYMQTARPQPYTEDTTAVLDVITRAVQESYLQVKTPEEALESNNEDLLKALKISG